MPSRLLRLLPFVVALAAAPPTLAQTAQSPAPAVTPLAGRDVRDEVIYELFVRNATPEGTFRAAVGKLPDIRALGATTVWLMPIQPVGVARRKGTLGSPYSIRDYTAINPELGTDADFRAFVAAAHAQGLRVIVDLVANHTAWDHPWLAAHPDWYTRGADGQPQPPVADWTDVVDLNYGSAELRAAMLAGMRYWVERFDIDGYRCDVAELVPEDFWATAIASLRTIKPVLMLAEGQQPGLHRAGFDLTYDWHLYGAMKRVWKQAAPASDLAVVLVDSARVRPPDATRLRFTTNHDETAWDRPPIFAFNGTRGAEAAFWTVALLPGAPLVYNGQEGGSTVNTPLFERSPLPTPDPAVREVYETALDLRARYAVLRRGELVVHRVASEGPAVVSNGAVTNGSGPNASATNGAVSAGNDVLLFERTLGTQRVLVAVNTRARPRSLRLPADLLAAYNGTRRGGAVRTEEVLNTALQDQTTFSVGTLSVPEAVTLGPYEVRTWGTVALRTR